MGTLEKFKEASPDYDPDQLLEAISVQRGIDKMKITEQKQFQSLRENDRELGLGTAEIVKVEARRKTLEAPLKKLDSLYSESWNDDLLDMTFKATTKLGKPKDVLEAIYLSGSISSMKEEVLNLQRERSDEESKLKTKKAETAHFATQLVMVDELIDLGLRTPAIAKLLEMVRKLGLPESVFTAITSYGSVENLEKRKRVLESLIAELETRYAALQEMVDKANKEHLEIQKLIETHLDEMKLAKVIQAVSFSPKQDVQFGMKYAIMCLSACRNICRGIEVKKMVRVRDILGNKYPIYLHAEYEVQDLLHLALAGLIICDSQGAAA